MSFSIISTPTCAIFSTGGDRVVSFLCNGIKDASKEFGFKLKIIGPSVLDDTQMYEALQNALVENPDLIVTTPYNFSAIQGLYTQAKEKGIPIINISSDSDEAGRVSFIGTDNTAYGQLAADYIN
ncbi:sugar ABC transporter substrate-binding protein [Lacrimispora sp.]|uniref:sugar ABC transporter substrate-binding protein n=1 Tax=Lacrimispora sp. TaxID=2719234 RepID=UPI002896E569|nr:substrate-binding domain-containing protein [Lacrimispora sp.]